MTPKPFTEHGWIVTNDILIFDWDSESNMESIRDRVADLLKGCGCKTGCQTRQCGCQRKGKKCTEGCNCTNCTNTACQMEISDTMEEASIEEIVTDAPPEDLDEIMEWVFGDYEAEGDPESDNGSDADADY